MIWNISVFVNTLCLTITIYISYDLVHYSDDNNLCYNVNYIQNVS